jgi:hypothetical protein
MADIKKTVKNDENLPLDTAGGEMPDPNHKLKEKASDAAKAFKKQEQPQKEPIQQEQKKKAG